MPEMEEIMEQTKMKSSDKPTPVTRNYVDQVWDEIRKGLNAVSINPFKRIELYDGQIVVHKKWALKGNGNFIIEINKFSSADHPELYKILSIR